ncbi:MAG: histidinol-phosphatase HisJ family protein [Clostridia bacterium]|nr:histidinol-phosphatase HisJ family protein [Clostridia bacterium]
MNYCGYHTHTNFSDGKNTPEEMVRAAIALGMPAIGFSDHSDTPCDQSYCMKMEQYPAYLAELDRLKEKYADKITVMRGLELDYDSDMAFAKSLDYFLGSVHYLMYNYKVYAIDHARDIQLDCINTEFGGDKLAFAKAYFDTVVKHIRRCKPTIVGHFDVLTKFSLMDEDDPEYQKIALGALEEVVKVCPVVEVNTGAISRKWRDRPYPADFLLRGLREMGGEVILGADTHATDTIDCAFPLAVELIKKAGFDHLLTLWPDGFRKEML